MSRMISKVQIKQIFKLSRKTQPDDVISKCYHIILSLMMEMDYETKDYDEDFMPFANEYKFIRGFYPDFNRMLNDDVYFENEKKLMMLK